jgi:hypothetical protein
MMLKPQDIKYHTCPLCKEPATVLVEIENDALFYLDSNGNVQYYCTNCLTTFSVDAAGNVVSIKLTARTGRNEE